MSADGLRARKKARTHRAISEAAIALFLARGFDQVSVADVAAAAEVSKPTLFRYFDSKEDLVLHRIGDHAGEWARVVRAAAAGDPPIGPLTALYRHVRTGLDAREPTTGLNDHPAVLAYNRLVFTTPSLAARVTRYTLDNEAALADALGGDVPARLAAAQLVAVQRVLAQANWQRLTEGRSADEVYPAAVADLEAAFTQLREGLAGRYG